MDKSTPSRQLFWGGVLRCQCDEHKCTSERRVITMRVQFLVFSQGLSLLSVSIQSVVGETRLNPHGADSDVRIAGQRGDSSSRWYDKKCHHHIWIFTQPQRRRMRSSNKFIWSAELDRREWKMQNADRALFETGIQLQSHWMELYQANPLTDKTQGEKSWLCNELEMKNRAFQEDRSTKNLLYRSWES